MYHGCDYERKYKRDNRIFVTNAQTYMSIVGLIAVQTVDGESNFVVLGKLFNIIDDTLCRSSNRYIPSSNYIFKCAQLSDNIVTVLPENIKKKCIRIPSFNNQCYIVRKEKNFDLD